MVSSWLLVTHTHLHTHTQRWQQRHVVHWSPFIWNEFSFRFGKILTLLSKVCVGRISRCLVRKKKEKKCCMSLGTAQHKNKTSMAITILLGRWARWLKIPQLPLWIRCFHFGINAISIFPLFPFNLPRFTVSAPSKVPTNISPLAALSCTADFAQMFTRSYGDITSLSIFCVVWIRS